MSDDPILPQPPDPRDQAARFKPQPIAPWLHTVAVLFVLILSAALGRLRVNLLTQQTPRVYRYLSTAMLEWLLLGSVIAGIYSRRAFLIEALKNPGRSALKSMAAGITVYLFGFIVIAAVGSVLYFTPLHSRTNTDVVLALAPDTPLEFVLWFGLSLTAGFCEELIFRGYLMQQFTAWTTRPILAILLTALLFGSIHLYEGIAAVIPLTALAIVYGFVVRRFHGDLRAVIVAHTLQDFLVAFLVLARPFVARHQPHP